MRLLLFLLISGTILISCDNNRNKVTVKDAETGATVTYDVKAAQELAEQSNNRVEELKKLPSLTVDQLKAMLPEEFMGMKRSNFSVNAMMGTSAADATYKDEGDKRLKVQLIDCAGEGGSGIYTMRYYTLWNYHQEDDNGYQKTVDFNGSKAIEKYEKYNEEYGLTYMADDRVLVVLEGEKMTLDEVREAAKNLKINVD